MAGTLVLDTILANVADELRAMAVAARSIDEAAGDMVARGPADAAPAAVLQEVDRVRQSLDCLHILMENLARAGCGRGAVAVADAADGVYLEAIRKRCLQP